MVDERSLSRHLRVGIVGAGLMGHWHAHAARRAQGTVVAVADPNPDAACRLTARGSGVEVCANIEDLLDRIPCDVIHVCTPAVTHEQVASCAIQAGKHVVVEKPLTPDVEGTQRLLDRATERRVLICPVHQFMFQDGVIEARRMMSHIGEVRHMEATFCSAGGVGRQARDLDALVAEILPHPLSLMQSFLPGRIVPETWQVLRPVPGEFRAMTEVGTITASVLVSLQARPTQCTFLILGTSGTLHLDLFHGYVFKEPGAVSKARKMVRPFDLAARRLAVASFNLALRAIRRDLAYPGLTTLVTEFYQAVRRGGPAPISPAATLNVARVRDILSANETLHRMPAVSRS